MNPELSKEAAELATKAKQLFARDALTMNSDIVRERMKSLLDSESLRLEFIQNMFSICFIIHQMEDSDSEKSVMTTVRFAECIFADPTRARKNLGIE